MKVPQKRVLWNVLTFAALSALLLWILRERVAAAPGALALGVGLGALYGFLYWMRLQRRITRRDRRFERNRIFVRFMSSFEVLLLAIASSHHAVLAVIGLIAAAILLGWIAGDWWGLLSGGFGLGAAGTLAAAIVRYELRHGGLYYQYHADNWAGVEALLYQVGTVHKPLTPRGTVQVVGELWNAESVTGEPIEAGVRVEVLNHSGLTLKVDRAP